MYDARNAVALILLSLLFAGCSGGEGVPSVEPDGGGDGSSQRNVNNTNCKSEYPKTQGPSEPCCPEWGIDACGPGLVCAALDGRTQPACYTERSRAKGEGCTEDRLCTTELCLDGVCASESPEVQEIRNKPTSIDSSSVGEKVDFEVTVRFKHDRASEAAGERYVVFLAETDGTTSYSLSVRVSEKNASVSAREITLEFSAFGYRFREEIPDGTYEFKIDVLGGESGDESTDPRTFTGGAFEVH